MSCLRHATADRGHFPGEDMQAVSPQQFGQPQRREFLLYRLQSRAAFLQPRSFGYSDIGITKVMPRK